MTGRGQEEEREGDEDWGGGGKRRGGRGDGVVWGGGGWRCHRLELGGRLYGTWSGRAGGAGLGVGGGLSCVGRSGCGFWFSLFSVGGAGRVERFRCSRS